MLVLSRIYSYIISRKFERENFSKDNVMDYDHKKFSAKRCWVNRFNCYADIFGSFHFAGTIMFKITIGAGTKFVVPEYECSKFSWD